MIYIGDAKVMMKLTKFYFETISTDISRVSVIEPQTFFKCNSNFLVLSAAVSFLYSIQIFVGQGQKHFDCLPGHGRGVNPR